MSVAAAAIAMVVTNHIVHVMIIVSANVLLTASALVRHLAAVTIIAAKIRMVPLLRDVMNMRQDGMTDMRRHLLHRQPIPLMSPTSKSLN